MTLLIMADIKTHATLRPHMRPEQYSVVDVFPVGTLQIQQAYFYTIDVTDIPHTIAEFKTLYLVTWENPLDTEEPLGRRSKVTNIPTPVKSILASDRHYSTTWKKASRFFEDAS